MKKTKTLFLRCFIVCIIVCIFVLSLVLNVGAVSPDGDIIINLSNPNQIPYDATYMLSNNDNTLLNFGSNTIPASSFSDEPTILYVDNGSLYDSSTNELIASVNVDDGTYLWVQIMSNPIDGYDGAYEMTVVDSSSVANIDGQSLYFDYDGIINVELVDSEYHQNYIDFVVVLVLINETDAPTCPSLQVQINQFSGSYDEFEGLLLGSSNETIYQGYRNKLQEQFRLGADSVTLEQLLAEYDGSFQQLITLLSENNLRLLDEYSDYIEEQRNVSFNDGYAQGTEDGFNDGYAQGTEDGFNDGYNRGYNKGSSEVFGDTLLGDTFNMPLNALNNWVLFETPSGIEVTMGGLATGLLALSILIILIKMFAGG